MLHDEGQSLEEGDAARIFALTRPDEKLLTLYFLYSLAANVAFLFAIVPLYFRYITLRYRFDEEGVSVAYGILWRKETYLTYSRIQDIHVTRNLFERWLGLGTVEIQTASGSTSAEESVVGIRQYNEVRNFLYARMRGHRLPSGKDGEESVSALADEALAGIRDELRAIRRLVEEGRHV